MTPHQYGPLNWNESRLCSEVAHKKELDAAEYRYAEAKQAGRAAAELVKEAVKQAKAQLKRA